MVRLTARVARQAAARSFASCAVALRFGRARRVGGIGEQVEDGDGTEWAPDGVPEVPVEPVVYGEHARLPQVPDQGPECDRAGRAPEVEDVRSGGRLSGTLTDSAAEVVVGMVVCFLRRGRALR